MNNDYIEITDRLKKNESRLAWLTVFAVILFIGYLCSLQAEYNARKKIKETAYISLATLIDGKPEAGLQISHIYKKESPKQQLQAVYHEY